MDMFEYIRQQTILNCQFLSDYLQEKVDNIDRKIEALDERGLVLSDSNYKKLEKLKEEIELIEDIKTDLENLEANND